MNNPVLLHQAIKEYVQNKHSVSFQELYRKFLSKKYLCETDFDSKNRLRGVVVILADIFRNHESSFMLYDLKGSHLWINNEICMTLIEIFKNSDDTFIRILILAGVSLDNWIMSQFLKDNEKFHLSCFTSLSMVSSLVQSGLISEKSMKHEFILCCNLFVQEVFRQVVLVLKYLIPCNLLNIIQSYFISHRS